MSPIVDIGFFLTHGMSLARWNCLGILSRELKPYTTLADLGYQVTIFTYGSSRVDSLLVNHKNIRVVSLFPLSSKYPSLLIYIFYPYAFLRVLLCRCDVFRTNQVYGSLLPLIVGRFSKTPCMLRGGYEMFTFWKKTYHHTFRHFFAYLYCKLAYNLSTLIELTSEQDARFVRRFFCIKQPILIRPNWIDTSLFNKENLKPAYSSITVGRLVPQKNHIQILKSFSLLDPSIFTQYGPILFIGSGPCQVELEAYAQANKLPLQIINSVSNNMLPSYLSRSRIYVHASVYEGNPKTLLEALSHGIPVVSLSSHRLSRLLLSTDSISCTTSELPYVIQRELIKSTVVPMNKTSRSYIVNHYSFQARIASLLADLSTL